MVSFITQSTAANRKSNQCPVLITLELFKLS